MAPARECGEPRLLGEPGRRALYFCGSIRGGREDRELYQRIVSRLRRFGAVLTEHVAAAELGARGEAPGSLGSGSFPSTETALRPGMGARAQTARVCVQLRCEPRLRPQLLSRPLGPSWRTFFSSSRASAGRAA